MKVSIVTTTLPERLPFLQRLIRQAPWIRDHEWIICGPGPLIDFARQYGAVFLESKENMGTCRNLCAEAATGDIIVQIDDDDWQFPDRVAKQVAALQGSPHREVVGSSWLYCLHAPTATASRISRWDSMAMAGASLAYWRRAWERHPFPNQRAEDGPFVDFFATEGTLFDMHDPKLLVYLRHEAHLPEQRDWWRETRTAERRLTPHEVMRRRFENPGRPLDFLLSEPPRDLALAHEEEAATVYVKWLMGTSDFELFCGLGVETWETSPPRRQNLEKCPSS